MTLPPDGLVPPHDAAAEEAIVSAAYLDSEARTTLRGLVQPKMLYAPVRRMLLEAIYAVDTAGTEPDEVTVRAWLNDRQQWNAEVAVYFAQIMDAVPSLARVDTYAKIVRTQYRKRQGIAVCQRIAAEGYGDVGDPEEWFAAIQRDLNEAIGDPPTRQNHVEWIDAGSLAQPVPEQAWAIEGLQVAPGRPTMFAGYGGSGKTFAAMDAALCYAAGRRVWSAYGVGRGGKVVHWNWDQGGLATQMRYQSLARGHGIDLRDLGDSLRLANRPAVTLTHPKALDVLMRECDGANLALFDALRGATAGAEENDSSIRQYMDLLSTLSERTGVACVLLHHTKKRTAERSEDPRELLRGSSAILDGSGAVWLLEGDGADPRKVHHVRQHELALGEPTPMHLLAMVREEEGIRFEWRDARSAEDESSDVVEEMRLIWRYICANPWCGKEEIKANVRGVGRYIF